MNIFYSEWTHAEHLTVDAAPFSSFPLPNKPWPAIWTSKQKTSDVLTANCPTEDVQPFNSCNYMHRLFQYYKYLHFAQSVFVSFIWFQNKLRLFR